MQIGTVYSLFTGCFFAMFANCYVPLQLKTTYVKYFEKRHLEVENLRDIQSSKNSNKDSHSKRNKLTFIMPKVETLH